MSFSLLRVYNLSYENFFKELIKKENLKNKSYNQVAKIFFDHKVAYSNSFSSNMRVLNNKCEEIIYNFHYLQNLWDQSSINKTSLDIFLEQLEEFRPDVIFFQGTPPLSSKELKKIKQNFSFVKKIIVHCGFQINNEIIEDIDILLLASPHLINLYKNKISNIHHVYHYFDEDVLNHIKNQKKENFLMFSGKTGSNQNQDHHTRYHLLDKICHNFDIKCYSQEFSKIENKRLVEFKFLNLLLKNLIKKEIFLHDKHIKKIFNPVFGIEMYNKIKKSYAVINSHVNFNGEPIDFSVNMRLFETTGVGTAIFTENSKNIYEIFNKDEVIVYENHDDLISKINYYKNNLEELVEIGKKGQKHTLEYHTAKKRIKEINQIILNNL